MPITQWAQQGCLEVLSDIAGPGTLGRASAALRTLREGIVQGIRDALTVSCRYADHPHAIGCRCLSAGSAAPVVRGGLQADDGDPAGLRRGLGFIGEVGAKSDGRMRPDIQVLEAFHRETERAASQPVVYGTLGDGTGAVAPWSCPPAAQLVLDAAQMRLRPERAGDHIRRGWPVVLSGSGFLGSPGATGALALPAGRFPEDMICQTLG